MKLNRTNLWLALVALIIIAFVVAIHEILLPFVLAIILAYILHPLVDKLKTCHVGINVATSVITIGFCLCIVALFLLFIPLLQSQILEFMRQIPRYSDAVWKYLKGILTYTQENIPPSRMAELSDSVSGSIMTVLTAIGAGLSQILTSGIAIFNLLALLIITPVVLFYVLRDWNELKEKIGGLVPKKYKGKVNSIWSEIDKTLSGFIRGQTMVCLSLAVYYGIGLSCVGLEFGALIGLLTGILSFIPYFGFGSGLLLSLFLGLMQGLSWGQWGGLAVIFGLGQILEGYILTPRLVGKQVGLNPVWIIFSLLAGGALLGFLGILIAVPAAAVIGVFVRHLYLWYQATDFYKGNSTK